MKAKPKKPQRRGAQPRNKNALKHGFYSRHFKADENTRLDAESETSITAEINLIRVLIDRLSTQISFDEITRTDQNGNESRDAHYLAQLNTLAAMTTNLATLIRTHYLTRGKSGAVQDSILAALEELRLEMGL
jgi:hypothetical protein